MEVLIKKARIIDPNSSMNGLVKDILISNNKIERIEDSISDQNVKKCIEAKALNVSPGWFDFRVCFGEPGYEVRETLDSGVNAALRGGFTGALMQPLTAPVIDNAAMVQFINQRHDKKIFDLQVAPSASLGSKGSALAELHDMHLTGVKAFTNAVGSAYNADFVKKCLEYCQTFDGLLIQFSDTISLSKNRFVSEGETSVQIGFHGVPSIAESSAINQYIQILEYLGTGRLHFSSVSTKESVEEIKRAKDKGLNVTCDVNGMNILFNDTKYFEFDANFKVYPPLRSEENRRALISALNEGVIDVICSDHNPQNIERKKVEFEYASFGVSMLDTFYSAYNTMLSTELPIEKYVECVAINPRKILGLDVPVIEVNKEANVTFFDSDFKYKVTEGKMHSKSKNSPFIGETLRGKSLGVINNGKMVS